MRYTAIILLTVLTGCSAARVQSETETGAYYEGDIEVAKKKAADHCEKLGKKAVLRGVEGSGYTRVSNFDCVAE